MTKREMVRSDKLGLERTKIEREERKNEGKTIGQ
jgi:hypothetical protein